MWEYEVGNNVNIVTDYMRYWCHLKEISIQNTLWKPPFSMSVLQFKKIILIYNLSCFRWMTAEVCLKHHALTDIFPSEPYSLHDTSIVITKLYSVWFTAIYLSIIHMVQPNDLWKKLIYIFPLCLSTLHYCTTLKNGKVEKARQ